MGVLRKIQQSAGGWMSGEIPTIYEWAGGRAAFERWLGRFYDLVEDDDQIAPLFGGKVSDQHRRDVVTWWCEVMGGPATYTEGLGGYEHMVSSIADCTSPVNSACAS
jgi:hemoglobin